MALNIEHLKRLTARVDFNALSNKLGEVKDKIVSMEDVTNAAVTAALDTESETYADDVVKAEQLQNLLSSSGMESVVNRVLADLDALSATADELQSLLGGITT